MTSEIIFERIKDSVIRETFQGLLREQEKHHALLEQARRENVTEVILEPMTGLYRRILKFL